MTLTEMEGTPLPKSPLPSMRRSNRSDLDGLRKSQDVRKLLSAFKAFRELSMEMPMQQAELLLTVAANPGICQADLPELTGFSASSVSRNVHALSLYHRNGGPGLGLVEVRLDAWDTRRHCLYLTAAGAEFVKTLVHDRDMGLAQHPFPCPVPA